MKKKLIILDTNIFLNDPKCLFKFKNNDIVIPLVVLEELDKFKKDLSISARNARHVAYIIDYLSAYGNFSEGIELSNAYNINQDTKKIITNEQKINNNAKLFIFTDFTEQKDISIKLKNSADNNILALLSFLNNSKSHLYQDIVLITNDILLRVKAKAFNLSAQSYKAQKVQISDDESKGLRKFQLPASDFENLQQNGFLKINNQDFYKNEYLFVQNSEKFKKTNKNSNVVAVYKNSKLYKVLKPDYDIWGINPRNSEQICAIDALIDDDIKLVTLTGIAGTGKTLLAMAAGLYKTTDDDVYQKLLVSRPIFPIGRDIGFLPGDIDDKLSPWMQPIFDSLEFLCRSASNPNLSNSYQDLFNQNIVSVEPLTYIRGRSLANHYFVVDEAQNLTAHEVKAILTRVGSKTKIVLTGDPNQIDLHYIDAHSNGLVYAINKFKDYDIAAHVSLQVGERSQLAELAAKIL